MTRGKAMGASAVQAGSIPVLQAVGLTRRFGSLAAVDGVDLVLEAGARHALIGPNGAGKTSLVNLLSGALHPDAGRLLLDGRDITRRGLDARARLGLLRTFQINRLMPGMTAHAVLSLAVCRRLGIDGRWWRPLASFSHVHDEASHWLGQCGLAALADRHVEQLSHGQQRLLDLALALACQPRVLLLDEPAAGLPAGEVHVVLDALDALPETVAVLLIEHDMQMVLRFASQVSVLARGRIVAAGHPADLGANPVVRELYLGPA